MCTMDLKQIGGRQGGGNITCCSGMGRKLLLTATLCFFNCTLQLLSGSAASALIRTCYDLMMSYSWLHCAVLSDVPSIPSRHVSCHSCRQIIGASRSGFSLLYPSRERVYLSQRTVSPSINNRQDQLPKSHFGCKICVKKNVLSAAHLDRQCSGVSSFLVQQQSVAFILVG